MSQLFQVWSLIGWALALSLASAQSDDSIAFENQIGESLNLALKSKGKRFLSDFSEDGPLFRKVLQLAKSNGKEQAVGTEEINQASVAIFCHEGRMLNPSGEGSGVILKLKNSPFPEKAVVVTAAHVTPLSKTIHKAVISIVNTRGEVYFAERCLHYDQKTDLAVYLCSAKVGVGLSLTNDHPTAPTKVAVCGRVGDYFFCHQSTQIIRVRKKEIAGHELLLGGMFASGSSGSPILNAKGEILGIILRISPQFRLTQMVQGDHFSETNIGVGVSLP